MRPEYELRLATRAAHLYWVENMRQADIAARINVSQAGVSRLLKRAQREGIVTVSITPPRGSHHQLEAQLAQSLGLEEVIITDAPDDSEAAIIASVGDAAAQYLEATLQSGDHIGISSWSSFLLSMSDQLRESRQLSAERVVQLMGGMSNGGVEHLAESLTLQLARQLHAHPAFMHVAGIASSAAACQVMCEEPYVRDTIQLFDHLTVALLGIGTLEPSRFLARSGNTFSDTELADLAASGAVGDVCLRFFDAQGRLVDHPLNQRVVAISPETLQRVPRLIGVPVVHRRSRPFVPLPWEDGFGCW